MAQKVFIDANHLIRFGHGLKGAEAMTLRELVKVGAIELTTTDLTIREVAKRFAKNDTEKLQEVHKADFRAKVKQYLGLEIPEISRDDLWRKAFDEHFKAISEFFRDLKAPVLRIETVSPMTVLEDYTHSRGLFSTSSKKDQFPDAFIFEALKASVSAASNLLVLSHDGDFQQACASVDHIRHISSFQELLDAIGIESAGDADHELIGRFEDEFREPVEEVLKEYIIYADDIEDGEIEVLSLKRITLESLTVYRSRAEKNTYLVYAQISCKADVSFTHPDWDSAIWDSEDKVYIPLEIVEGTTEVEIDNASFTFTFEYDPETDSAEVSNPQLRGSGYVSATLYPQEYY